MIAERKTVAQGLLKHVYDQIARDLQVVPPLMLPSPNPELLARV